MNVNSIPDAMSRMILNPYERFRRVLWLVRNGEKLPTPQWKDAAK